jgi:acyl-CoA thioesterase I
MHELKDPRPVMTILRYAALLLAVQSAAGCSVEKDGGADVGNRVHASNAAPAAAADQQQERRLVLAFGDSLYAGYGLDPGQSFPAMLEAMLEGRGIAAQIVNAGVSGDTTAGGLRRLEFTLDGLERKPDLAIVGLGANDMLRGIDPAETRQNLRTIVEELKQREIPVMLTGMAASRSLGADYVRRFEAIYPEIARDYGAELDPFFMEDVITDRSLLMADGLHPNAEGIRVIARRLAPKVAEQLSTQSAM